MNEDEGIEHAIPEWKKSLIRAEFIKLYFDSFGINNNIEITRYTELFNFHKNQNQDKEKLLFAIVKTNGKSELIPKNKKETRAKLCNTNQIKIMFPRKAESIYDSSVDFLELCFSGLLNQKNANLFRPNSVIANFFKRFNEQYGGVKDKTRFDLFDKMFKEDPQVKNKHLEIVDDVFGDELSKIHPDHFSTDACYSLFIVVEGQLIEYVSKKDVVNIVPEEVNEANVAEKIQNYITKQNKLASFADDPNKRIPIYYDDIVLFRECMQKQKEETISSNSGEFLIILLSSILFIVNFMIELPESIFYDKKVFLENYLKYPKTVDIKDQKSVEDYLVSLETLLNEKTKGPEQKKDFVYLNYNTILMGMTLNYAEPMIELDAVPLKAYATDSNYYGHTARKAKNSIDSLVPNTKQIYYAPMTSNFKNALKVPNKVTELTMTLMVFNSDHDIAVIDTLTFTFEPFGNIIFTRKYIGFRPFLNKGDISISLLVLNIFLLLTLVYDTYRVINLCVNKLIDYFKFHINSFDFSDCLDIVTFIMVWASIIWFYVRLLWRSSTLPTEIICKDEACFVKWVRLGLEMNMYHDFTSVVILLVFFKLIKFIYNSFPALGIVFDTFSLAIKELLSLFILCFIMIIGFFFVFQSVVGGYSISYENLGNAFISTYLLFVGIFDYTRDFHYYSKAHPLSPYMWIVYYVLFQFLLSNIFLCLIHSTFRDVKQKKQMFNDAVFQMSLDSFFELYEKVLNLFFFKAPQQSERHQKEISEENKEIKESKERDKESSSKDKEKDKEKDKAEIEADNAIAPKAKQLNIMKILKYNFSNLHLETLFKKNVLNLEEFEAKKQESYYKLRKKIMQEYVEELEANTSKDFDIFITALLYVIYAIMLVVVIYYQQRLGEIKEAKNFIERFYEQNGFFSSFKDKNSLKDMITDMDNFIKAFYIDQNSKVVSSGPDNSFNVSFFDGHYTSYSDPFMRVTIRQYQYTPSTKQYKNATFPEETKGGSDYLDSSHCPFSYEMITDKSSSLTYSKPGLEISVDKCGGYVFNYTMKYPTPVKDPLDDISILDFANRGSIILDYFIFSNHRDFLIYSRIEIYENPMGVIDSSISHTLIPFNKYVTLNDFARLVCEIIYYIFFLIFFLNDAADIYRILYRKLYQNYLDSHTENIFKDSHLINKYYRFTLSTFKKDKGAILILKLIFFTLFKFIYKTILLVYYLVISIFEYVFSSIFNFIDFFAIVISIVLIAIWFYIISITYDIDNYSTSYAKAIGYNLGKVNHLYHLYSLYTTWQSINIFFLFLRLIQYLQFSETIYMQYLVFSRSKLLITLYLIFICIVNLGFVFFGYALFSENLLTFKTIGSGLLSLFVILAGRIHQSDLMEMSDNVWRPIFLFIFLSFNLLVFLNFFYSIVLEAYQEIRDRQAKNLGNRTSVNFARNIYNIILGKRDIFIEVCSRYKSRVEVVFKDYLDKKVKQAKEIANDGNKKMNKKKCCGNLFVSISVQQKFFEIIKELSQRCLLENDNDLNGINLKEKRVYNKYINFEPNSLQNQVSIYHKIIIYLISVANVSFPLVKPRINSFFTQVREAETKNIGGDANIVENKEKRVLNKWDNKFFQEYSDLINNKSNSFFKKNIFEKYYYQMGNSLSSMYANRLVNTSMFNRDRISRLSKETNFTKMESLFQNDLFMVPSILSKQKRTYHTLVYCSSQCQTKEQNGEDTFICEDCIKQLEIFDSFSSTIYDIMIKYFFLPTFNNFDDRDLYLGYYVYEMNKDSHSNNQSKNLSKEIPNHKIKLFNNDIQALWKIEDIEKITISSFEMEKEQLEKKNTKYYDKLPMTKERLFFYYNIWNTIYLILYSDNIDEVKRIQRLSKSYELLCKYKEDKKKGIKNSLFNYLFTELNGLRNRKLDHNDMQKYNLGKDYDFCEALRYVMRNERLNDQKQLNADDFDKIFLFYSDNEKLMINLKEAKEEMFLKERENSIQEQFKFETYPQVFLSLWKKWRSSTLFKLFFGYNELIDDNKGYHLLHEMGLAKFLIINANNFDLFNYFTNDNKAEVLMMLNPPQKFVNDALKILRKFYDQGKTEMVIEKIQTFTELLNHFKDNRVNLLAKHKYFAQVFESTIGEIKRGLLKINDHYNFTYHQFLRYNNEVMTPVQKIAVGKFFTHAKEKERFDLICEICKNDLKNTELARYQSHKDTDEEFVPEKLYENVDELYRYNLSDEKELKRKKLEFVSDESYRELYKTNPFIWILSLDPFDFLDVCEKIRDADIREFYLEMYIFVYGEDQNKESYYLKRKVKMNFIEKYDSYLKFVKQKEAVEKKRDMLIEKERALNDAVHYLETRKKQYEIMYNNWEKEKKMLSDSVLKANNKLRKDN